jgi:nucleoside-diphosphate-sugar epimerase
VVEYDLKDGLDVLNQAKLTESATGCGVIFHLAGHPSVGASVAAPGTSAEKNFVSTACVLGAAQQIRARVVLASSSAVYGMASPYALYKKASEDLCRLYYKLARLDSVCLRYFNVYGPGQKSGVIPIFLNAMRKGDSPTIYGDGMQTRDFVHVTDVARATALAGFGDRRFNGKAMDIGTGTEITLRDLVYALNEALGTKIAPKHEPAVGGEMRESRANVAQAKALLKFRANVSFWEGIRSLVEEGI